MSDAHSVARLEDIAPVKGEFLTLPVRLHFGIRSFGVNAYAPGEGGHVIEEHDELGAGAGRHEELYFVARGHASFTLAGEEVDAPAGTFVFVSDPAVRRSAVARDPDTVVLVVGGVPGKPFGPSPWEAYLEAAPFLESGDLDSGIAVFEGALAEHPGNANVLYNLACFEALADRRDDALAHLAEAIGADPRMRAWAESDSDFDSVRDDPRFPAA
ncbi:MAG TPA: tetratricopeptide repeat protein [Gaiellaceae bacterium]